MKQEIDFQAAAAAATSAAQILGLLYGIFMPLATA
jgi:hypothetical protein